MGLFGNDQEQDARLDAIDDLDAPCHYPWGRTAAGAAPFHSWRSEMTDKEMQKELDALRAEVAALSRARTPRRRR
jgi:hypothetical protein